jgi:hypothetical protein
LRGLPQVRNSNDTEASVEFLMLIFVRQVLKEQQDILVPLGALAGLRIRIHANHPAFGALHAGVVGATGLLPVIFLSPCNSLDS